MRRPGFEPYHLFRACGGRAAVPAKAGPKTGLGRRALHTPNPDHKMSELEPLTPSKALKLYLRDRESELSKQTHRTHRGRIQFFIDWCESDGIQNLNELTGRDLRRYKIHRSADVETVTVKSYMDTLRVFLRFCSDIDAVDSELPDKVQSPSLERNEGAKTAHIDSERAKEILQHLRKYQYASVKHVVFEILWHTSIRRGALLSIDLRDWYPDERYFEINHRPEKGTPLKNGESGERPVSVNDAVATVIQDWIRENRHDVVDEYGRKPLITSKYGRIHGQTVQKYVYMVTRPCYYSDCPHDRIPDDCEATENADASHKCPSSHPPHNIRRSSITHFLREGASKDHVSDRSDVSGEVLEEHYNQMTEQEKMNQRRDFFDNL